MLAWKYAQKSATLLRARRRLARQEAAEKAVEKVKVKGEGEQRNAKPSEGEVAK